MQIRQALLLGLAYNLYRLRHRPLTQDVNRAINTYKLRFLYFQFSRLQAE
jgi:hypothetical protein